MGGRQGVDVAQTGKEREEKGNLKRSGGPTVLVAGKQRLRAERGRRWRREERRGGRPAGLMVSTNSDSWQTSNYGVLGKMVENF